MRLDSWNDAARAVLLRLVGGQSGFIALLLSAINA